MGSEFRWGLPLGAERRCPPPMPFSALLQPLKAPGSFPSSHCRPQSPRVLPILWPPASLGSLCKTKEVTFLGHLGAERTHL